MDGAGAVFTKSLEMSLCSVAHMTIKPVFRIAACKIQHDVIPTDLSQDAGCTDRKAFPVTLDNRLSRAGEFGDGPPIDQCKIGSWIQAAQRMTKGEVCGLQNVDLINGFRRND